MNIGLELMLTKAVSDRLFSDAIDNITSSDNHSFSGHTAAGFPENTLSAKASTWYNGIVSISFPRSA